MREIIDSKLKELDAEIARIDSRRAIIDAESATLFGLSGKFANDCHHLLRAREVLFPEDAEPSRSSSDGRALVP